MKDAPGRPRSRASGRITLADVAREAGVSPITVSRALRADRNVAEDLIVRVKAAAERLAYVPDPAAQALASARSRNVAMLVPLLSNRVFSDLIEAVQRTLLDAGYQMLIGVTHYDPREEERLLQSFVSHRPAGLLLTGFDRSEGSRELLAASELPRVHLMENSDEPGVCSVGFSQQAAGEAITRHLLDRGRRRIAFVGAQLDPRVMQRAEGYRAALRSAGRHDPALELLDPRASSIALGAELWERLLAEHADIDAVFFCNDDLAQGALLAAMRTGVKVPRRVAVAGFNDLEGSDQMPPGLTTIRTPRAAVGEAASRMLLSLIRGEAVEQPHVDLGFELVVRRST